MEMKEEPPSEASCSSSGVAPVVTLRGNQSPEDVSSGVAPAVTPRGNQSPEDVSPATAAVDAPPVKTETELTSATQSPGHQSPAPLVPTPPAEDDDSAAEATSPTQEPGTPPAEEGTDPAEALIQSRALIQAIMSRGTPAADAAPTLLPSGLESRDDRADLTGCITPVSSAVTVSQASSASGPLTDSDQPSDLAFLEQLSADFVQSYKDLSETDPQAAKKVELLWKAKPATRPRPFPCSGATPPKTPPPERLLQAQEEQPAGDAPAVHVTQEPPPPAQPPPPGHDFAEHYPPPAPSWASWTLDAQRSSRMTLEPSPPAAATTTPHDPPMQLQATPKVPSNCRDAPWRDKNNRTRMRQLASQVDGQWCSQAWSASSSSASAPWVAASWDHGSFHRMSWEEPEGEPSAVWQDSSDSWCASSGDASQSWDASQPWVAKQSGDTASSSDDNWSDRTWYAHGWSEASWENQAEGRRVRPRYGCAMSDCYVDGYEGQARTPGSITSRQGHRGNRPRGQDPNSLWNTGLHKARRDGGPEAEERYKREVPKPNWWDIATHKLRKKVDSKDPDIARDARTSLQQLLAQFPKRPNCL